MRCADIVEKEFDGGRRESADASDRRLIIADGDEEQLYDGRFDLVVGSDRRLDNRFHGQRENFADLYISEPPSTDGDDAAVYSDVQRHRHERRTNAALAIGGSALPVFFRAALC